MQKLTLILFLTLFSLCDAKIIDAIALVVNGEPITTAEIKAVEVRMQTSKAKAQQLLISDRLQKIAMKDITIPQEQIDKKISFIAQQNGITLTKMQAILKQQGTPWSTYRATITKALKKEKFFQTKVASTISPPTQEELKIFYLNHKDKFVIPQTIHLIEYSAPTQKAIKNFLQTGREKGIKHKKITKSTLELEETLLRKFLQTSDGSFIQPLNAGDRYITYKVISKEGQATMPFEGAKRPIMGMLQQKKQTKALKEYFQKLKTSADIEIVR